MEHVVDTVRVNETRGVIFVHEQFLGRGPVLDYHILSPIGSLPSTARGTGDACARSGS